LGATNPFYRTLTQDSPNHQRFHVSSVALGHNIALDAQTYISHGHTWLRSSEVQVLSTGKWSTVDEVSII
jgi:hypothetical protein